MLTSMAPLRPHRHISTPRRLSSLLTPPDLLFLSHAGSPLSVFHTNERYSTKLLLSVPPPPRNVEARQDKAHHGKPWSQGGGAAGGEAKEARSGGVIEAALSF
ncbi:Uncharacterized protein Rs2_10167 [Raphanus sativus]|nr:Uncharacterized protein Rs2_10167 [Raphanus sativus]